MSSYSRALLGALCLSAVSVSAQTPPVPRPIVARHSLIMALEGYGKAGMSLFKVLDLAAPEAGKAKKGKAA